MKKFEDISQIAQNLIKNKKKLIYIAGASASGKSYFAKLLKNELEKNWQKVFAVSSDMYYTNDSWLKYLLYWTFDHPKLIAYDELAKNLQQLFTLWQTQIPEYSFVEKRRIWKTTIKNEYDFVIVEWLYTISQLPNKFDPFKIFVYSDEEELIFRRLIRDQQRTQEPLHTSIQITSKVFPMRNIYWKKQKKLSDLIVYNDYNILSQKWKTINYSQIQVKKSNLWELKNRFYITDFEYNDKNNQNWVIVVSEVYRSKKWLLEFVKISKKKQIWQKIETIEFDLFEAWILTWIHSLLQLAWLKIKRISKKIISTYYKDNKQITIKEYKWKFYLQK